MAETQKKLSVELSTDLARQLGRGLLLLHNELGVVHGDFKPQNIIIFKSNALSVTPKIIDFDGCRKISTPARQTDSKVFSHRDGECIIVEQTSISNGKFTEDAET